MRIIAILLSIALFFELLYCFLVFTNVPVIKYWREQFISTALSTMEHQWLADYFLPKYMVEDIRYRKEMALISQEDDVSKRPAPTEPVPYDPEDPTAPSTTLFPQHSEVPPVPGDSPEESAFYSLFWELNRSTFEQYVEDHPSVLDEGWENIYINEAGLDDMGTSIYTTMGEQVLAIDAKNKILLLRVQGSGYLGVLAIAKDPTQLRCEASPGIGSYGQYLGTLVSKSGGILGITGSGFVDPDGRGNGGLVAGYTMCEGKEYGSHYTLRGYKRIELTVDNKMYITNAKDSVASDVTDAVEFAPALVVDGQMTVDGYNDYNGINPRACIGQSSYGEIMMLVIEGRQIGRSIGTDVETCAKILMRHDAYTAMNLDGGTSAIMWYDGEYVTKCSNTKIQSRYLPNAWVYGNYE
ncbi:MAG: phosphodiester glycosidase family protein [Oscillospiraceae bacterium]|nr:phosphodiester glycosidase family protein [Oscillospiraceae bacterium]